MTQADKPLLCVDNPYLAFAKILTLFSFKPYQPKGIESKSLDQPHGKIRKGPDPLSLRLYWRPLLDRRSGHPLSWSLRG